MHIEARHVKRKLLSQYLETDFLKRERKSMEHHNNFNNAILANRKRLSTELSTQKEGSSKKTRLSESVSVKVLFREDSYGY